MSRLQQRTIVVIVLAALSLGLIALTPLPLFQPVREALSYPLSFIQRPLATIWTRFSAVLQQDPEVESLRARNSELEAQIAQLKADNVRLGESEADMRILSNLLNYAESQPAADYMASNVIGRDTSPLLSYIILDRGSDDGIARGMPVVTADGLVGAVVEVTRNACKVRPVTDPASRVTARLQGSRSPGVVEGSQGGVLTMNFIAQGVRIAEGELVLTSGLGGDYPADIVIGSVANVEQLDYEVLQAATLNPSVNFAALEIVLIITDFQPIDLAPFFTAPTATPVAPSVPNP